jgi:hypothetical protein
VAALPERHAAVGAWGWGWGPIGAQDPLEGDIRAYTTHGP